MSDHEKNQQGRANEGSGEYKESAEELQLECATEPKAGGGSKEQHQCATEPGPEPVERLRLLRDLEGDLQLRQDCAAIPQADGEANESTKFLDLLEQECAYLDEQEARGRGQKSAEMGRGSEPEASGETKEELDPEKECAIEPEAGGERKGLGELEQGCADEPEASGESKEAAKLQQDCACEPDSRDESHDSAKELKKECATEPEAGGESEKSAEELQHHCASEPEAPVQVQTESNEKLLQAESAERRERVYEWMQREIQAAAQGHVGLLDPEFLTREARAVFGGEPLPPDHRKSVEGLDPDAAENLVEYLRQLRDQKLADQRLATLEYIYDWTDRFKKDVL